MRPAYLISALLILLAAGLLFLALIAAANAHQAASGFQYPKECCSGRDCREALEDEVKLTREGAVVVPTGEVFRYEHLRYSPDGKIHRCLGDPKNIKSRTLCLFISPGGF